MPRVKPLRGLRYASQIPLPRVITEPYDKITPAMQGEYYRSHPYNYVRLILGKTSSHDTAKNNWYKRAATLLNLWIVQGILQPDEFPAFYLYEQAFQEPFVRNAQRAAKIRRGIIGLVRLEDFSKGRILPHERTLAKPRKDRLRLLQATRANLEQIFLLYGDESGRMRKQLETWCKAKPLADFRDRKGVRQRIWRLDKAGDIRWISRFLGRRKLFIADGHHRYTISWMYHERQHDPKMREASAWRMATFVDMDSPGLVILPTHRVVQMPASWKMRSFLDALKKDFEIFPYRHPSGRKGSTAAGLMEKIRHMGASQKCFGLIGKSYAAVLKLRRNPVIRCRLSEVLEKPFRSLDVTILHALILEGLLGINPKSVEQGSCIAYIREAEEVARKVHSGQYSIGFLQNPPDMKQVKRIALAGRCMPQKSTDFYPKLLSGLVAYDMMGRGLSNQ